MPTLIETLQTLWAPVAASPSGAGPTLLNATSSTEDARALDDLLRQFGWSLEACPTLREAIYRAATVPTAIVVTDLELPDGRWDALVSAFNWRTDAPRVVVSARQADERLWSEVLNLGAFDLISRPYEFREVQHVVTHAWSSWQRGRGETEAREKRMGPASERATTLRAKEAM